MDYLQKTLLENSDQYSKARLLASAQSESGAWISAIPVPNLGTQLNPDELRIAIALRTGAWISEIYTCKCGKKVDEYGYHQLSCHFGEGRFPRHSALNDIIWRALKSAGIPSELEPVGLNRGDGKRPDGIIRFPFSHGKALCWDATCVNSYGESTINNSAMEVGQAAAKAETTKRTKYPELARRFRFEPIAIVTSGVFTHATRNIVHEIGKRISEKIGDKRETLRLKQ